MAARMSTTRLVVRPHRPGRQFVLLVAGALALGIATWMAFEYGQWQDLYVRMSALARASKPDAAAEAQSLEELKARNDELKQRVAILERAAQIDQESSLKLKEHLRGLQDEVYALKEELQFYRNVVASSKGEDGLQIQAMRVAPLGESGRFHYNLVLTNLNKDDKVAVGSAIIEVSGKREGAAQKFRVTASKGGPRSTEFDFSFVHFHRLEGELTLPEGFTPETVRVIIREDSSNEPRQDASYDWKSLVEAKD
jgi:hypothetical protein